MHKSFIALAALLSIPLLAAMGGDNVERDANGAVVVKIVAQRFNYTPAEVTLKRGQPAVLEFTSLDFIHGFKVPDLKLRADLPPGKVIRIPLTPDKAGTYDFLCDNFCGAGHEEMNGRIIVVD